MEGRRKAAQSETSKEIIATVQAEDDENLRKSNECTQEVRPERHFSSRMESSGNSMRQFGDRCSGSK